MTDIQVQMDAIMVCRICLQSGEGKMTSIFDRDPDDKAKCLYEKIESCGGIKILRDPELPTCICSKCNACLTVAHKFRIICFNSDNYLREFVCKKTSGSIDEDEDTTEYLFDEDGADGSENKNYADGIISQVLQPTENEIGVVEQATNYEVVDGYTEFIINTKVEDDLIEEEDPEGPATHQATLSPCKTLGINPDGTAVISIKPKKQHNKAPQLHICDICGNCYPRKYALEAHVRRHRDEKPFECELCGQSFHLNFQLTRHMRKHTGVRPYTCEVCKRTFSDRSTMVKHERTHRNERPFTCSTCNKSFTYSSVLKVHKLTHTGEKPFHCGICGKRFSRAHHLRAHLETLLHVNDPRSRVLLKQIKREESYTKDPYVIMDGY